MLAAHSGALDLGPQYEIMSYPYQQPQPPPYAVDYSNPASPWALDQHPQLPPPQLGTPSTHSNMTISPEAFQQQLSPMDSPASAPLLHEPPPPPPLHAPPFEPPRTIQVPERVPPRPFRFDRSYESDFLQTAQEPAAADTRSAHRHAAGQAPGGGAAGDELSLSTRPSSGGAGPSRVPHARAAHAHAHPYRRPAGAASPVGARTGVNSRPAQAAAGMRPRSAAAGSAAATPQERADSEPLAERTARASRGAALLAALPRTSVPCPAVPVWRVEGYTHDASATRDQQQQQQQQDQDAQGAAVGEASGSASTSINTNPTTVTQVHTQAVHPPVPDRQPRRLIISTDLWLDPENNQVTVKMEVPGVAKESLHMQLQTCPYTGCRQLFVKGTNHFQIPNVPYAVTERKTGNCARTINVPLNTKPEDVSAKLQDGLLTITFPGGTPTYQDFHTIAIQ